jgi:hypothetical protein
MKKTLLLDLEGVRLDREKLNLPLCSRVMLRMFIDKIMLTVHTFLNSALFVDKC